MIGDSAAANDKYEVIYGNLQKRRKELQIRVDKITTNIGGSPLNRDSEEQAVELENSEVQSIIYEEALKEISQINKTLDMIENKEYGKCIGCGAKIPAKRLEAVPHTSYCVTCAAKNR